MKLLIKLKRDIVDEGQIVKRIPQEFKVIDETKDVPLKIGKIPNEKLGKKYFKHEKDTYSVIDLSESDKILNFKRGAQIITPKDAGIIITKTGINKKSEILEAGTGSGGLAARLSLISNVTTVENSEINYENSKKNLKNYEVTQIKGDISKINLDKQFDVIILDIPNTTTAIKNAQKHLKIGGYIVTYCPQIIQSQKVVTTLPKNLLHLETIELIERQWKIDANILRPQTRDHQHTAFLTFIRKIN